MSSPVQSDENSNYDEGQPPDFETTSEFQRQTSTDVINHSEMILQMVDPSDNDTIRSSIFSASDMNNGEQSRNASADGRVLNATTDEQNASSNSNNKKQKKAKKSRSANDKEEPTTVQRDDSTSLVDKKNDVRETQECKGPRRRRKVKKMKQTNRDDRETTSNSETKARDSQVSRKNKKKNNGDSDNNNGGEFENDGNRGISQHLVKHRERVSPKTIRTGTNGFDNLENEGTRSSCNQSTPNCDRSESRDKRKRASKNNGGDTENDSDVDLESDGTSKVPLTSLQRSAPIQPGKSLPGAFMVGGEAGDDCMEDQDSSTNHPQSQNDIVVADAITRDDIERQVRRDLFDEVRGEIIDRLRREILAGVVPATSVERENSRANAGNTVANNNQNNETQSQRDANVDEEKQVSRQKCRWLFRGAIIGSLLVVVVVGLAVGFIIRKRGQESKNYPESHPVLWDLVVQYSPDEGQALKNSMSPQYQAFAWLTQDPSVTSKLNDGGVRKLQMKSGGRDSNDNNGSPQDDQTFARPRQRDDLSNLSEQEAEWLERYAMATLYFSTNKDASTDNDSHSHRSSSGWFENEGWLSNTSICEWFTKADDNDSHCEAGSMIGLDLHANGLDGTIPAELVFLRSLSYLNLADNQLEGGIFEEIGKLNSLRSLELQNNQLDGTIPPQLGFREYTLQVVNLERNKLHGTIPKEIADLDAMTILRLGENNLNGFLPSDLPKVDYLEVLDVHNNNFSPAHFGAIGQWISRFDYLKHLNLANTGLFGRLPTELSKLKTLVTFDVRNNSLTGQIPFDYGSWQSIENIYLDGNDLTGRFPSEVCELVVQNSAMLSADCNATDCYCCTQCCYEGSGCELLSE